MYLSVANKSVDSVTVTINNTTTYTYNNIKSNNRILDIGYVHDTDTVEVTSDTGGMNLSVYTLDEDKFIRAYNKLNSESYQVEKFSDTKFTGTLTASSDKAILFSIPYDGGWSVYIDGKKADTYAWENALLCVDVSAGTHTVVLK